MSALVLDTHALIWFLERSSRLSAVALSAIDSAFAAGSDVFIPAISLAEIVYLEEKGRIPIGSFATIMGEISRPDSGLVVAPLDSPVVKTMLTISRSLIPDLPDRIIAATATYLNCPLVTADAKIQSSGLRTIW